MKDNAIIWRSISNSEFSIDVIDRLSKSEGNLALYAHDERGFSIIHWAVILGLNDLVVYLLNKGVQVDLKVRISEEPQCIHLAALEGRLKTIDILIKYGADVNAVDKKGCTPLMRAAMCGQNADTTTADTILFLLSRGSNPKLCDNMGFSALHHATFFGREDAVSLLITIGLDANQRDRDGFKPLDIALHIQNRYIINELANETKEAQSGNLDEVIGRCSRKKFIDYLDLFLMVCARIFVLIFILTTVFWTYPQYIFNYYPVSKDLYLIHICIFVSSTCLWICWYRVMKKDPGYLPTDSEDYYSVLDYKLNLTDRKNMQQIIPDDIHKDVRLCHICRTVQPVRTRHCRFCKRCTELFDHHCMYLNNCIGKRNRLLLYYLIFHMIFVGIMYLILILIIINRHAWSLSFQHLANLAFCLKLITIGSILLLCTIRRAVINSKKRVESKKNTYKYLEAQEGKFYNQFDRSLWTNLKDYFRTSNHFISGSNFVGRSNYSYHLLPKTDSFDP